MADQKITALTALAEADVQATVDQLPIADVSTSETKKVSPAAVVSAALRGLAVGSVNGALIQTGTIGPAQIADGAVTNVKVAAGLDGGKLAADSVTAREIAANAVTASELADNAVDTAAIVDGAITNIKLAAGIDGAKLVADSVTAAQIAPNAITANELADNAVDAAAIASGAVTDAKLSTGISGTKLTAGSVANAALAAGIDGAKLSAGSVATAQVADSAITASKLATGAVGTAAIADSAVSDVKLAAGINGGKLSAGSVTATQLAINSVGATQLADGAVDTASIQDSAIATVKIANLAVTADKLADGSVGTAKVVDGAITTSKIAAGAVDDTKIAGPIGLGKLGTAAANAVLAGPTSGAAATAGFRSLVGADLPIATAANLGAIKVNAAGGLTISADGTLGLTLASTNLPLATAGSVGAVMPGAGLSVSPTGSLGVANAITPGTGIKVIYNAQGMITGVSALVAADIPDLDASKIVSGALSGAHIADRSVTQQKLADYAIAYIQEASPGSVSNSHPIGELWFQESSARLSMWNGNSWMAVGQGSLSNENLRFCGTFNAATGLVTAVTQFGTTAGLAPAAAIPAASNALTGVYLVCDTPGTYGGKTYDAGDWVLCMGQARGWERIDTLNGGGAGAGKLADMTDVTITTPADGNVLRYNGTRWVNTMANLDPGTY